MHFKTSQHGVSQENEPLSQTTVSPPFSTSLNPNLESAELLQLNMKAEVKVRFKQFYQTKAVFSKPHKMVLKTL